MIPFFAQSAVGVSIWPDTRHKSLEVIEDPQVKKQLKTLIVDTIKVQR